MKIRQEKTKYHSFTLEFSFSQEKLEFCRALKVKHGWKNFTFFESKWRFDNPSIILEVLSAYPETEMDDGVRRMVELERLRLLEAEAIEQKAQKLKVATETDFEVRNVKGNLRNYQKIGVEFFLNNKGRAILADVPGTGKSAQSLAYAAHTNKDRILIVSPASVKFSWENEVKKWTNFKAKIITSKSEREDFNSVAPTAFIINYDILEKHLPTLLASRWDCVLADEAHFCFPYKSKILTSQGWIEIGKVVEEKKPYDVVSFNFSTNKIECRGINEYFKVYNTKRLVRVNHEYGQFECTEDHKIFTNSGWKKAIHLSSGEVLSFLQEDIFNKEPWENNSPILQQALCCGRDTGSSKGETKDTDDEKEKQSAPYHKKVSNLWKRVCCKFKLQIANEKKILWAFLFGKMENESGLGKGELTKSYQESTRIEYRKKESSRLKKNEENDAEQRISKKAFYGVSEVEGGESRLCFFSKAWWQWAFYQVTTIVTQCFRFKNGTSYKNVCGQRNVPKASDLLQRGSSPCREENSYRGRWPITLFKKNKEKRSEKRRSVIESRVVSVEVLEQGSFRGDGEGSGRDKIVYNIEVAHNNNYFVDGVLVSNCKSRTSKRTKALKLISSHVPEILFLSGTPFLNRPEELFTILNMLDPRSWPNYYEYTARYCDGKKTRWGWEAKGATHMYELREKISKYFLRRLKSDVLKELPPKIHIDVPVEMDAPLLREYRQAEHETRKYLKEMKGKTPKELQELNYGAEKLVRLNILKSLTTMGKMKIAKEMIQEIIDNGEKVVVFSVYNEPLEQLAESFPQAVTITGKVPVKERGGAVRKFQEDPNCNVFLGGIKSAGVGITLTASTNVIFIDFSWTPADHDQASDRCHRIGTTMPVNVYQLFAKNTIDSTLVDILAEKRNMFDVIIDGKQIGDGNNLLIDELVKRLNQAEEEDNLSLDK